MEKLLLKFDKTKAQEELSYLQQLGTIVQKAVNRFSLLDSKVSISLAELAQLIQASTPSGKPFDSGKAYMEARILLAKKLGNQNIVGGKAVPWEKLIHADVFELPGTAAFSQTLTEVSNFIDSHLDGDVTGSLASYSIGDSNVVDIPQAKKDAIDERHRSYIENENQLARFEKAKMLSNVIEGIIKLVPGSAKLSSIADLENFLQLDDTGALVPNPDFVGKGSFSPK